jgi:hypothetical protein
MNHGNLDLWLAKLDETGIGTTAIPTVSEWGMIILAGLIIFIGAVYFRKMI